MNTIQETNNQEIINTLSNQITNQDTSNQTIQNTYSNTVYISKYTINNPDVLPTIDIIFPCRNRSWILPDFLNCIYNLNYPKSKISIYTLVNDSIDDSEIILYQFQKKFNHEYNKIYIKRVNYNTPEYNLNNGQHGSQPDIIFKPMLGQKGITKPIIKNTNKEVYNSLSRLRNSLINKTTSDFVLSIDTDILFDNNLILDLLNSMNSHNTEINNNNDNNKVHIMSTLICNGHSVHKADPIRYPNPYQYVNIMKKVEENLYTHITDYDNKGIIEVDLTGACTMFSRQAIKSGVKYYNIENNVNGKLILYGEDSGMSNDLQKLGYKLYCNTDMKLAHIMYPELLEKYNNGEYKF